MAMQVGLVSPRFIQTQRALVDEGKQEQGQQEVIEQVSLMRITQEEEPPIGQSILERRSAYLEEEFPIEEERDRDLSLFVIDQLAAEDKYWSIQTPSVPVSEPLLRERYQTAFAECVEKRSLFCLLSADSLAAQKADTLFKKFQWVFARLPDWGNVVELMEYDAANDMLTQILKRSVLWKSSWITGIVQANYYKALNERRNRQCLLRFVSESTSDGEEECD